MPDDGESSPSRKFVTLLVGVVMINVLYYVICWLMGRNSSTPVFLWVGNWVYGVVVVPLVCVVFSVLEVSITRLRISWPGGFLLGCSILSCAALNGAVYVLGGWLTA